MAQRGLEVRLAGFASSIQKICAGSRGWSGTEYRHGVVRPGGLPSSSCCRRELGRRGPKLFAKSQLQPPACRIGALASVAAVICG